MSIIAQILELALKKQIMLTCAESCTGGMVAAALTDLPGSSAMFDRGFVTYTNRAKREMLGVSADTLAAQGAVSQAVAREMALGALGASQAQIALSVSGIAGPGGSDHKPEGRVCFALAQSGGSVVVETVEFGALGRDAVRQAARDHGLQMILSALLSFPTAQPADP